MTDNIESVTAVTGPAPDPPDGYGTQIPFKDLPPYMQRLLRSQWNALAAAEQECVRKNLEDWDRARHAPDFSGPLTVGPISEGADNGRKKRKQSSDAGFTKGQTYGDFSTVTEDV